MMNKQLFLSTKEFSEKLGIQENKVRRWLRTGIISGKKIGRNWLIPISEVTNLIYADQREEFNAYIQKLSPELLREKWEQHKRKYIEEHYKEIRKDFREALRREAKII